MSPVVPTSSGGHQSGRYASYWNTFLFNGTAITKLGSFTFGQWDMEVQMYNELQV